LLGVGDSIENSYGWSPLTTSTLACLLQPFLEPHTIGDMSYWCEVSVEHGYLIGRRVVQRGQNMGSWRNHNPSLEQTIANVLAVGQTREHSRVYLAGMPTARPAIQSCSARVVDRFTSMPDEQEDACEVFGQAHINEDSGNQIA
jgi:hypothetical protein